MVRNLGSLQDSCGLSLCWKIGFVQISNFKTHVFHARSLFHIHAVVSLCTPFFVALFLELTLSFELPLGVCLSKPNLAIHLPEFVSLISI